MSTGAITESLSVDNQRLKDAGVTHTTLEKQCFESRPFALEYNLRLIKNKNAVMNKQIRRAFKNGQMGEQCGGKSSSSTNNISNTYVIVPILTL